jgi:hypothetical protein
MVIIKNLCKKCNGDMETRDDAYGKYFCCINCGNNVEVNMTEIDVNNFPPIPEKPNSKGIPLVKYYEDNRQDITNDITKYGVSFALKRWKTSYDIIMKLCTGWGIKTNKRIPKTIVPIVNNIQEKMNLPSSTNSPGKFTKWNIRMNTSGSDTIISVSKNAVRLIVAGLVDSALSESNHFTIEVYMR